MASWAQSICLKCGKKMTTEPCLVCLEHSWLNDYPGQVRWQIDQIEKDAPLPFKYHISSCEECGIEVLIAVEDPYRKTPDGRIAVMLGGRYVLLSDQEVDDEDLVDE